MVVPIHGLTFPFSAPPIPGKTIEVSPGVHWLSTYLPFRPYATNLWLLRDVDGWTMVDCGFPLWVVREQIEAAWSSTLGGRPITRLIVTHHHPDHVGNCRWICDRWGVTPETRYSLHVHPQKPGKGARKGEPSVIMDAVVPRRLKSATA
jgi:glyoxylase-like metal-dependent hydrolase (beta-lactamase superfamily II)